MKLCNTFISLVTQEASESYQKRNELINEAIQALQETTPNVTLENSLAPIENLRLIVDSIKEYTSNLKMKTTREVELNFLEKRLLFLQDKCTIACDKALETLKQVREYDEEA